MLCIKHIPNCILLKIDFNEKDNTIFISIRNNWDFFI